MYKQCFSLVAGLLAAAAFALCPATASAQHRGGGGGHGSSGWHGGSSGWHGGGWHDGGYGWRDGGWGRGWGWGWGGLGLGLGLGYPWYGGYRSGYWPGYYDYGYTDYYPYYASSDYYPYYGDTGTYFDGSYDGSSMYGQQPMYGYGAAASQPDNEARIRVIVPPDAKVWFGNSATEQTGQVRFFESPPLTPGKDYTYDVKAQWRDPNGKDVTQTRQIRVHANAGSTVNFMQGMQGAPGTSNSSDTYRAPDTGATTAPGANPNNPGTPPRPNVRGTDQRPPK